ncbi:hypothetical protein BOX15_Mlig030285g1 [Macrostomum lignano]|uniref:G-protein coupled receptors family 1 profile domain-containing protein n=1 Tax=Macrostomum lignano TaxID=282301 RepID=A0A267H1H3_9PLAT|nr:hypothetical protein BOX15_Mlig030285g1 [Macrostomum lignano]
MDTYSGENDTDCMQSLEDRYNSTLGVCSAFLPGVVTFARIIIPMWIALGVPGSLLSLLVWSSKPMRSSSSVYLCALAILDLMFLLCQQLPFHLYLYYDIKVMYNPFMCRAFPVYNMWLQYLSPLLTLGFTVERYIGICHPFSRKEFCTVRRAIIVVSCMTVACLVLGLVQLHFYRYNPVEATCSEDLRIFDPSTFEHRFYSGWSKLTEVLFFALAPVAILVFNILVLVEARRVIRKRPAGTGQRKSAATTATLLTVSFYQIGAVLPVTILLFVGLAILTEAPQLPCGIPDSDALHQITDGQWPVARSYLTYLTVSRIVDCLAVSHYAMKFVIYLATGQGFRRQLGQSLPRFLHCGSADDYDGIRQHRSQQRRRKRAANSCLASDGTAMLP